MSDKLTPRVGDRVIVVHNNVTRTGSIARHYENTSPSWGVDLDGIDGPRWFSADQLEVVDREPVAWPEGWQTHNRRVGLAFVKIAETREAFILSRSAIEKIVEDGPLVLESWDELVGGDS